MPLGSWGAARPTGSSGYCKVSLLKSSSMHLIRISLAQSFAHCSQAVGGGWSQGVGEDGEDEDGGEGNERGGDNGGDTILICTVLHCFWSAQTCWGCTGSRRSLGRRGVGVLKVNISPAEEIVVNVFSL